MTILTPTYDTGAVARASEVITSPPDRIVDDAALTARMPDLPVDRAFLADILSAALTHERCGRHLYRSVAARSQSPGLQERYEHHGDETLRHVEILEALITSMGGDPQYVSPAARAAEAMNGKILESTFLTTGAVDLVTAELAMLNAVVVAETLDLGNWLAIQSVAAMLPGGDLQHLMETAADDVLAQERDHVSWANEARLAIIARQVSEGPDRSTLGAVVETVREWFR